MAVYGKIRIDEGANIFYKNFSGNEYRGASRITFCVEVKDGDPNQFYDGEPMDIEKLKKDGWNVKTRMPRDPEDEPINYIQVTCKYTNKNGDPVKNPPEVVVTTGDGKDQLDANSIWELDEDNIVDARLVIRPYEYEPGKVSAYLKTLYVKVDGKIHNDDIKDYDKF